MDEKNEKKDFFFFKCTSDPREWVTSNAFSQCKRRILVLNFSSFFYLKCNI